MIYVTSRLWLLGASIIPVLLDRHDIKTLSFKKILHLNNRHVASRTDGLNIFKLALNGALTCNVNIKFYKINGMMGSKI